MLAQRTADATIKEAKEEANRVLNEAREEAARTRAEAEADARRGADSARVSAQAEVESLIANRDKLKGDLDALTRRIDEQRGQIRSGITEMQRLLDDPTALKPLPPVTLADVERPAPLEPADGPVDTDSGPDYEGANGQAPIEVGPAFAPGAQVAALQEPPAPPVDLGPPTQPVPFALTDNGRGPWLPSELRSPSDEPLGPPPAARARPRRFPRPSGRSCGRFRGQKAGSAAVDIDAHRVTVDRELPGARADRPDGQVDGQHLGRHVVVMPGDRVGHGPNSLDGDGDAVGHGQADVLAEVVEAADDLAGQALAA